jgi:uncharacterized protein YneF (UPF0154 family)
MGASAREIEEQIKETRDRIDANLTVLEQRAASNAVRVGKIVALVAGVAVGVVGGFFLYRRLRRRTLKDRLQGMSVDSLRDLAGQLAARARKPLPIVKVTVNEKSEGPGTVEAVLREVAPALIGTAATAILDRVAQADEREP